MVTVIVGSLAFSIGGAFMGMSAGFTRLWPSVRGGRVLRDRRRFPGRAVHRGGLSTTYVIGLGIEAVLSVVIGLAILGERLSGRRRLASPSSWSAW